MTRWGQVEAFNTEIDIRSKGARHASVDGRQKLTRVAVKTECTLRMCSIPGAWISEYHVASASMPGAIASMYTVRTRYRVLFRVKIPVQASGLIGSYYGVPDIFWVIVESAKGSINRSRNILLSRLPGWKARMGHE